MSDGTGGFHINPTTGVITVKDENVIDRERQSKFTLTVSSNTIMTFFNEIEKLVYLFKNLKTIINYQTDY